MNNFITVLSSEYKEDNIIINNFVTNNKDDIDNLLQLYKSYNIEVDENYKMNNVEYKYWFKV